MDITFPHFADVLFSGQTSPLSIFKVKFERYYFFDSDLRSSQPLLTDFQVFARSHLSPSMQLELFTSSEGRRVGKFSVGDDWFESVQLASSTLSIDDTVFGLSFFNQDLTMVACQPFRTGIGVLAIRNLERKGPNLLPSKSSFFQCDDVRSWVRNRTPEAKVLIEEYGQDFAEQLLDRYCQFDSQI